MNWNDFNDADDQKEFGIIPKGTPIKVRMTIKPGGYNDVSQGWTDAWATQSPNTGSIYLSCEFVVLEGQYARRKIWSLIGLHSPKGPDWGNIGRTLIKGILNSSHGVSNRDNSPHAQKMRQISGFGDLDGIVFVAQADIQKDQNGDDKNVIKLALTPDNKEYASVMGVAVKTEPSASSPSSRNDLPPWAQ